MDTNRAEVLLLKTEVFQIVGCAIEILNTTGAYAAPTATQAGFLDD